jgi:hypothetical protein
MVVKLSAIIDGMECQGDEMESYLDRVAGEVFTISQETLRAVEDEEDLDAYPDWQQEEIENARRISQDQAGQFVQLPTQWDIHEYDIMERFIETVQDEAAANALYRAIKGRGAFRYFKDMLDELGIQEQWFAFRNQAIKEIAVEWCNNNQIEYEDDCAKR